MANLAFDVTKTAVNEIKKIQGGGLPVLSR